MGSAFGEKAIYVGSKKCGSSGCHIDQYTVWKTTPHAKMIREIKNDPSVIVPLKILKLNPKMFKGIKYTVGGNHWKQRYMRGDFTFATIQWNVGTKEWAPWNLRGNHKWYRDCGGCHSTGYKRTSNVDPIDSLKKYGKKGKFKGTYSELNIGCEACHGPGSNHVKEPDKKNTIVNPVKLDQQLSVSVCGRCHTVADKPKHPKSGPRESGFYWWPNGFKPGDDLEKYVGATFFPFEPTGKNDKYFWADGTSKDHHQQYQDFRRSKHYEAGLSCINCHSVHSKTAKAVMTKIDARNNSLCISCHDEYEAKLTEHTKHEPDSNGSKCIECHMTKVVKNAVKNDERNHTFKFISPEKSIKHKMPNSCNSCHKDKSPKWALFVIQKWKK